MSKRLYLFRCRECTYETEVFREEVDREQKPSREESVSAEGLHIPCFDSNRHTWERVFSPNPGNKWPGTTGSVKGRS